MSIIKLLKESLFDEDMYHFLRTHDYVLTEAEMDLLVEGALDTAPLNWKKVLDTDNAKMYNFDIKTKRRKYIPRQKEDETDREFNRRVEYYKNYNADIDETEVIIIPMECYISITCRGNGNNTATISFKGRNDTYRDMNITNSLGVMRAVTYCIADMMKTSPCPIDTLISYPIETDRDIKKIPVVDDNGDPVLDGSGDPMMKMENGRAAVYKKFLFKYIPLMEPPREILKLVPNDGIPRSKHDAKVEYHLKPLASENDPSNDVDLTPIIETGDIAKIKEAIESGAKVHSSHIQDAFSTGDVEIVDLLSSKAPVTNAEIITASRKLNYHKYIPMLLNKTNDDVRYDDVTWGLIAHDNLDMLEKVFEIGRLSPDMNHANAAIENNAKKVLTKILSVDKSLGNNALEYAMKKGNLEAVKTIIGSGVKVTPAHIRVPTTKDVRKYIGQIIYGG